jgi:tRNA G10  N-methylase Trm11
VGGGLPVSLSASRGGGVRENLSLLDPFCGSGTILTEALLLEFKNIIGSDLSEKAVSDTKQNIEWIVRRYNITSSQYEIFQSDVAMLAKHLNPESIDAIVTEPYLGPQRGKYNVSQVVSELSELYSNALAEFASILKPESKVVMVWPIYRERGNNFHILPELDKFKIINPIPENLRNNKVIKLTKRNTIIYGRENQRVWREIVVLQ